MDTEQTPETGEDSEVTPRARYAALIEAFGQGWEKGKIEWVDEVFAPEAVFYADPFDGGLKGREAITGYWKDVPKEQAEISFRAGEMFIAGPWFATEFRCTFRRRRTGEWLDVRGSLFCETENWLISEMRMYWHRASRGHG